MLNLRKTLIAACLTAIVFSLLLAGCTKGTSPSTSTPPLTPPALSEQPDKATFEKYFSEMGLGRLPTDGKLPFDIQKNVTVFSLGDNLYLYGTVTQEVQISARYYNVTTKEHVAAGAPPVPLKPGGFASGEIVNLTSGKYEYKVYVGDTLVAIFTFEVR